MALSPGQRALFAFNAGLITPRLAGRADLGKAQSSCRRLQNMTIGAHGLAARRAGLQFVDQAIVVASASSSVASSVSSSVSSSAGFDLLWLISLEDRFRGPSGSDHLDLEIFLP